MLARLVSNSWPQMSHCAQPRALIFVLHHLWGSEWWFYAIRAVGFQVYCIACVHFIIIMWGNVSLSVLICYCCMLKNLTMHLQTIFFMYNIFMLNGKHLPPWWSLRKYLCDTCCILYILLLCTCNTFLQVCVDIPFLASMCYMPLLTSEQEGVCLGTSINKYSFRH